MIEFDSSKIETKFVYLKYITRAVGGTMSILDVANSTDDDEKFIRVAVPRHVVDSFVNSYMSKYIKPILTAVCYYDGVIIALQPHPMGNLGVEKVETLFGTRYWESNIHKNVLRLNKETSYRRWFIDGAVVYNFDNKKLKNLSKDGKFQALEVTAYRLTDLGNRTIDTTPRTCIAFTASTGQNIISPPVWRDMNTVGKKKMDDGNDSDDAPVLGMKENQFDKIDRLLSVNLNFALRASKVLIENFGYDAIEPLRLDDLMVGLKTVNLPNIDQSIKNTHDIGLKFTHAMAWLIGLGAREQTLESMTALRGMLRYLTSRGIVHKTALSKDSVFRPKMDMSAVPLLTMEEVKAKVETQPVLTDTFTGLPVIEDADDMALVIEDVGDVELVAEMT